MLWCNNQCHTSLVFMRLWSLNSVSWARRVCSEFTKNCSLALWYKSPKAKPETKHRSSNNKSKNISNEHARYKFLKTLVSTLVTSFIFAFELVLDHEKKDAFCVRRETLHDMIQGTESKRPRLLDHHGVLVRRFFDVTLVRGRLIPEPI